MTRFYKPLAILVLASILVTSCAYESSAIEFKMNYNNPQTDCEPGISYLILIDNEEYVAKHTDNKGAMLRVEGLEEGPHTYQVWRICPPSCEECKDLGYAKHELVVSGEIRNGDLLTIDV